MKDEERNYYLKKIIITDELYIYIYISNPFFFSVLVSVMTTIDIIPNKNKKRRIYFWIGLKPYRALLV